MAYYKEIRLRGIPKELNSDMDAIIEYFGVSISELIKPDMIIAIKQLKAKIPPDRLKEPKSIVDIKKGD